MHEDASFFFNATATTEIYTLSLHDALPILGGKRTSARVNIVPCSGTKKRGTMFTLALEHGTMLDRKSGSAGMPRPISYAVFCLKKKREPGRRRGVADGTMDEQSVGVALDDA